jgi:hypothetical protein
MYKYIYMYFSYVYTYVYICIGWALMEVRDYLLAGKDAEMMAAMVAAQDAAILAAEAAVSPALAIADESAATALDARGRCHSQDSRCAPERCCWCVRRRPGGSRVLLRNPKNC